MTRDEAEEILANTCPCTDRMCPDSVHLGELAEARDVLTDWDAVAEARKEAAEDRAADRWQWE